MKSFVENCIVYRSSSTEQEEAKPKSAGVSLETSNNSNTPTATIGGSADLLGLGLAGGDSTTANVNNVNGNGFTQEPPTNNLTK